MDSIKEDWVDVQRGVEWDKWECMEAKQIEKETSEDQIGVSTMDTTCNLPIGGDKKVLERKRPAEQKTESTSIQYWHCVRKTWVVKRSIAH